MSEGSGIAGVILFIFIAWASWHAIDNYIHNNTYEGIFKQCESFCINNFNKEKI